MITLTRRYHFAASHRLHVTYLTAEENRLLFGKCNNPFGHGHDYFLSVSVTGHLNTRTGLIVPIERLDNLVHEKVLRLFAYSNLNLDLPQFRELVPTTENVASVIGGLLQENWANCFGGSRAPRLTRIHLQETDRNGFELPLSEGELSKAQSRVQESATVHG